MSTSCTVNLRAYAWLDSRQGSGSCWFRDRKRKIFSITERSKVGQRSFTTSKTQSFQFDDIDSSPHAVFHLSSSLLLNGFNVSLWLDKTKFKPQHSQLNNVTTDFLSNLISKLSNETYLVDADDGIRVSWNISISCYEVLGEYVRDLLVASSSSTSSSSLAPDADVYNISPVEIVHWGSTPLRLRDNENGAYLSGLQSLLYRHSDSTNSMQDLLTQVEKAISHRAILMQSSPGYKFESIGDVGHCIIEINLEQLVFTKRAEYIKRNSVCKLVAFADLDSLCYKPANPNSNLILMDMLQMKKIELLIKRVVLQSEPDRQAITALQNITRQDKLELRRTIISSSIRSLSTLTRIAKLLNSSVKQHIPYRDSILTRIFQPLLEGNYCPLLVTTACGSLQNKSSTLNALRFASQLRCICNEVSRNDFIITLKSHESENIIRSVFERSSYVNIEGISYFEMIMDVDMMTQRLHMHEERLLMAHNDFDALERTDDANSDGDILDEVTCGNNMNGNIEGRKKRQDVYQRYSDIQKCMEGSLQEASHWLKSAKFFSTLGLTLQEKNGFCNSDINSDSTTSVDLSGSSPPCLSTASKSNPSLNNPTKTFDERYDMITCVRNSNNFHHDIDVDTLKPSLSPMMGDQSSQELSPVPRNYNKSEKTTKPPAKIAAVKGYDYVTSKNKHRKRMTSSASSHSFLSNSPPSVTIVSSAEFPEKHDVDSYKHTGKPLMESRSSLDLAMKEVLNDDVDTSSIKNVCDEINGRSKAIFPMLSSSMESSQEDMPLKELRTAMNKTSIGAGKSETRGSEKLPLLSSSNNSHKNDGMGKFKDRNSTKEMQIDLHFTIPGNNKDCDEVDDSIDEGDHITPRSEARKRLFATLWTQDSSSRDFGITSSSYGKRERRREVIECQTDGQQEYTDYQEEDVDDYPGGLSKDEEDFLRAVSRNLVEEVEACLLSGVNIHTKNSFGRDGMQICSRNGYIQTMEVLASWGGSYNSMGPNQDTLLHIAVFNRQYKALKWLADLNIIDVNRKDIRGQTIVHIAARRCELKIIECIAENAEAWKIDFALKDYSGQTPYDSIPRLSARPNVKMRRFFETKILPCLSSERAMQRVPPVDIRDLFASVTDRDREMQERVSSNSLVHISQ